MSNQFYFFVPCVFCIQLRTLALDLKVLMIKVELQVDTKNLATRFKLTKP